MSKTRLLFRADGNSQIGLGHVVRSLALAELLNEDFTTTFIIQNPTESIKDQIKTACNNIIVLPVSENETDILKEAELLVNQFTGNEIIVLDGYQFPTEYQHILKKRNSILVCLDDLHDRLFEADAIINIAGGVTKENYSTAPYTKLYSGPKYALLRKPFRDAQKKTLIREDKDKDFKILVCFGGADPENYTLQYTKKLLAINPYQQLEIVTGSAYQHSELLQNFIAEKQYVNWQKNLTAEEMANLMQQCATAICSASSVAYEYCAVNGMLFIEKTAENQAGLCSYLISENLALPADKIESFLTSSAREKDIETISQKQHEIFNGEAEKNLKSFFSQLNLQANFKFRKATQNDANLLFDWANDPEVRKFSFNPEPISYETHVNWLNGKLNNPNALLLITEIQNQPAALLRFDRNSTSALISYQIAGPFRGKGLGHRVLQLGLRELKNLYPEVTEAIGYVQPENVASVRAFEKVGFMNFGIEKGAFRFEIKVY